MESTRSNGPLTRTAKLGWIPCSEKLPNVSEYVFYCTDQYQALGKREREKWYRSAYSLEVEENPVLYWRPVTSN